MLLKKHLLVIQNFCSFHGLNYDLKNEVLIIIISQNLCICIEIKTI